MAILVFNIDIFSVPDATSVLHGAFNNTLCCDRFFLSRGSWEIWRKTRQSTPPKPEPDAALLKNKVNHNMCIGLLDNNKKTPQLHKTSRGRNILLPYCLYSGSLKRSMWFICSRLDENFVFAPFLCVFVLKGFPQLTFASSDN